MILKTQQVKAFFFSSNSVSPHPVVPPHFHSTVADRYDICGKLGRHGIKPHEIDPGHYQDGAMCFLSS